MKYNVEKVLSELGLEVSVETGDERYLNCPFHIDSDPSFSINSKTGLWVCFAGCGQGNLVSLVSRVLDLPYGDAKRWLDGYKEVATTSVLKQKLNAINSAEIETVKDVNYWSEGMLKPYYNGKMSSYIFQRGFSKEILKHYGIGYDLDNKDIIIPVRKEDGVLVGTIRRSTTGGIRYTNSPGLIKKSLLFGLDRVIISTDSKRVFVGEGPFDTIWMAQAGLPAVGLLGSDMSDEQASLLVRNFCTVVMVLDNDKAGKTGMELARKKLLGKVILLKGVIPEGKKDAQDMGLEELSSIKIEWVRG